MSEKKSKVYNRIVSELYNTVKTASEEDGLTYYEIIGLLYKLIEHFATNICQMVDIRIKRDMKRNFSEPVK